MARLHRAEGVDVRCGVGVAEVRGTEKVEKVVLSDGAELDADIVVVGIGSHPATGWLEGSGIEVDNGVVCDAVGRASAPHVWAIGDVASWRNTVGHQVRVEHWSNVADQARALVPAMLGQDAPAAVTVPYFWSDQYDVKIQCLGEPEATDTVHVVEDDGRKFLAFYERDGVVAGVVGGGMPGKVMKVRSKIAAGAPIADVLVAICGVFVALSAPECTQVASELAEVEPGALVVGALRHLPVGLLRRLLDDRPAGLAHPGHRGVDVLDRPHRHGHLLRRCRPRRRPSDGSAEPASRRRCGRVRRSRTTRGCRTP